MSINFIHPSSNLWRRIFKSLSLFLFSEPMRLYSKWAEIGMILLFRAIFRPVWEFWKVEVVKMSGKWEHMQH